MSRKLYKHQFHMDWSRKKYQQMNVNSRRFYRQLQKEKQKKQNIPTVLFIDIDQEQLQITQQNEKRKKNRSTEHQTIETGAVLIESDSEERETIEIEFI